MLLLRAVRLRFDFPMMVCECLRAGLDMLRISEWRFADSVHVLRDVKIADNCAKLQCLTRACGAGRGMNAHRALDDVRVLLEVSEHAATRQGVSLAEIVRPHIRGFNASHTLRNLACAD